MRQDTAEKIEEFLTRATIGLVDDPGLRAESADELRTHLEARIAEALDEGLDETVAFDEAAKEFGDPEAMAAGLVAANAQRLKARSRNSFFLRRVLVPVSIIVAVLIGLGELRRVANLSAMVQGLSGLVGANGGITKFFSNTFRDRVGDGLSEEGRLLVFSMGGAGVTDGAENKYTKKALWESEPRNPAYYVEYITGLLTADKPLPENMVSYGEEIDPGNSYYRIMAAAGPVAECLGERSDGGTYDSVDQVGLTAALGQMHEIVGMPRYSRYRSATLRERFSVMQSPSSFQDQLDHIALSAGLSLPEAWRIQKIAKAIGRHAEFLTSNGDRSRLEGLAETWLSFTGLIAQDIDFLIDGLVAVSIAQKSGKRLAESCRALGLEELAERVDVLGAEAEALHENWKSTRGSRQDEWEDVRKNASILAGVSIPVVGGSVPLPDGEVFRPGRRIDYIQIERAAVTLMVTLLLTAMIAFAFAGFRGRKRGVPVVFLLDIKDYAIVVSLGVLTPLVAYILLTRLTPLGGQDVAVNWGFPVWIVQLASFMMFVLMGVGCLVRWRLGCAVVPGGWFRNWGAFVLLGSVVFFASLAALFPDVGIIQVATVAAVAAAVAACGLSAFSWWRGALSAPETGLLRSCIPACGGAILAVACTIPLLGARERIWIARDTVFLPENGTSFSSIEDEVTRELRTGLATIFRQEAGH